MTQHTIHFIITCSKWLTVCSELGFLTLLRLAINSALSITPRILTQSRLGFSLPSELPSPPLHWPPNPLQESAKIKRKVIKHNYTNATYMKIHTFELQKKERISK